MRSALPGSAQRAAGRRQSGPEAETASYFAGWLAVPWSAGDPHFRHSRRVALLKRVLPVIGVSLLLLIAMWPRLAPMWERMRLAFPAIDLRDARELQMINPRYAGVDRTGRPFVVTAASGRQVPDRQDLMSLQMPRADIKTHHGDEVVVTAQTGVYQSQTQLLDLFGNVTLVRQDGTRLVTEAARVDAAHNTAEGNQPVEGHGPSGDVKAQGFRILDRGTRVLFTGRSDLLLKGAKPAAAKQAPAALPAPIAREAARAEAEAKPLLAAEHPAPVTRRRIVSRAATAAAERRRSHPAHARRRVTRAHHATGKKPER